MRATREAGKLYREIAAELERALAAIRTARAHPDLRDSLALESAQADVATLGEQFTQTAAAIEKVIDLQERRAAKVHRALLPVDDREMPDGTVRRVAAFVFAGSRLRPVLPGIPKSRTEIAQAIRVMQSTDTAAEYEALGGADRERALLAALERTEYYGGKL